MTSEVWDERTAASYDEHAAEMYAPEVLGPTVDFLADLASGGRALEFAIGTGRVACPVRARGVPVGGVGPPPAMVAVLRNKPGADAIHVAIGDMTTTTVPGEFD